MKVVALSGATIWCTEGHGQRGTEQVPNESRMLVASVCRIEGPTQRPGKYKVIRILKSVFQSAITSHREARDTPCPLIFNGPIARINIRDQLSQNVGLIFVGRHSCAVDIPTVIPFRRNYDHLVARRVLDEIRARNPIVVMSEKTV